MSGTPRPEWPGTPRVSPMKRLRRLRPRARPRFKGPSFNRIIPNLLTLMGLCAGLTSLRLALEGRFGGTDPFHVQFWSFGSRGEGGGRRNRTHG